ncbi:MAG: GGDEF domain-containing response regulator [Deltaproteobacteria bacterium]|nr:GGDEF domain-containing response regulator [Deltaproteobacteria bacterium]
MDTSVEEKSAVTVLYVEDNQAIQKLVARMITRRFPQLKLVLAENGQVGLDYFLTMHPDIIITDIQMPVMDGIQMSRKIKAIDKGAKIIAITAFGDVDSLVESINLGINHYVLKPIKNEKLIAAIEELLKEIQMARQLRLQNEYILQMAYYDSLTGLPNRQLFKEILHQSLAHAQRHKRLLAVLFLDLDRFKVINDTLGHAVGDQLLKAVAHRLKQCCRRDEEMVSRRGGDEFIILLPDLASAQEAVNVARKIIDAFALAFVIPDHDLFINTCIGISLFPNDGVDEETLIKNADMAMYCAKEQGRNRYHLYNPSMDTHAAWRHDMENSLRMAQQRGEFFLNYQSEVNVKTGRIFSVEALLRWQHPELGLVLPNQFIHLAEETGLILTLGEWALRSACAQNKAWQGARYPNQRVAVNLSPRQVQSDNLADMVENVLRETKLAPRWLELEVTEDMLLHDLETVIRTLRRLSNLGVHISIDDFGTGYSSLSYLQKLPIHTLKIDQSFVSDITVNPDDSAIAKAIITMAKSLRLNVIAEGVEAEKQMRFLYTLGCWKMQGYFFSTPVSAEEFSPLIYKPYCHSKSPQDITTH